MKTHLHPIALVVLFALSTSCAIAATNNTNSPAPKAAASSPANTASTQAASSASIASQATGSAPAAGSMTATANSSTPAPVLKTQEDRISYTLGVELGRNMKSQGVSLNINTFSAGLNDGMGAGNLQMSDDAMRQTMADFQKQLVAQHEQQFQQQAKQNQQQGDAFLANNAKQPGMIVLPSGLQYKIVKAGSGTAPTDTDLVTVNYQGTFIDGTVFDSSYQRGEPATFPVSAVIPGWQQALKLMQPGATWEIYVPAKLAYGEQGMGDVVGPNETLIFKVDLLTVKPAS